MLLLLLLLLIVTELCRGKEKKVKPKEKQEVCLGGYHLTCPN